MKKILLTLFLLLDMQYIHAETPENGYLNHPGRTELEIGGFYEGKFEDGTTFQMNLPYPLPKSTQREEGATALPAMYWYPRRFSGETIKLEKNSFNGNNFTLIAQRYQDDKITEEESFKGTLSSDKTQVSGIWTHIKSGKKLTFSMNRVFEYKDVFVSFPTEAGKDYQPKRPFEFSVRFPVIGDPKVDDSIREFVSQCEWDLECSNVVEIAWYSKELLSLSEGSWGYSAGMAHGNGSSRARHYVRTTSHLEQVNLDHFMSTSSACLALVSRKIVSELEHQGMSGAENGALKEEWKKANFLPTPKGIRFDFDPYEVGSYAEGAPSVFIERKQLGNCLKYLPSYE